MEIQVDMVQDSIGQLCPMPIAFMAKNMKKLEAGQVLEIRSDDEGAHDLTPAAGADGDGRARLVVVDA